ncbi:MAG: glycosyltransferase family 4 protein [Nitrospinae bacterium]|nr:glycosyltransferase family 4 protein [Nitrospinota bacterium]
MKYKVAHIITRMDKGGSAENTLLTVLGLNKEKYDVTLIKGATFESVMSDEEREANERDLKKAEDSGVKIITVDELVRRISPLNDLKAFIKLFFIIKKGKYHIVHTHTSKAGIIGRWAAWLCRFGKLTKTPVIIHTPHGHIFYGYYGRFLTWIFKIIERITGLITDRIITLTDREKQEHIDFKIAPPEKFVTIHSGVEVKKFFDISPADIKKVRGELNIPDDYLVVGTVGRLVEVKGHKYFIQAAKNILNVIARDFSPEATPSLNIKFIIVGDGPLISDLKRNANLLGIADSVIFTGWRNDVPAIISVFDIFVLPSLNEGMGKVLVEAMLLKRPIIASRVGGIPDLIRDGENGILVNSASPNELAKAIIELLKSEEKRKRMGESGKLIVESYSDKAMIDKIGRLYEEVINLKCKSQNEKVKIKEFFLFI